MFGMGIMELIIILFILFALTVPAVIVIIVVLARRNKGPRDLSAPGFQAPREPPPLPADEPGPEDT